MDNRHYQAFANATTPPELSSLASEGYASSGSASENQLPTVPGAAWFHSVASELHNAILALGVTPDHLQINQLATGLTNLMGINNGNDYFNPRDITNLIYTGNGAGTLRAQIAQGDFRNVHPGDYIIGKSTGTKWIVAHNDYWFNRGDSPLTRHHLCLIPEILAGNSGNLLWSGRTYAGSGVNNTTQGYAPWASDNWSEGKNNTSGAYYNSFIKQSILPKVYTYWLKKDFEDQGISLLTFRNLLSNATNTNAPVKGYSAWTGASSSWAWYDSKCDLLSEANVYGNNHWQSSGFDCGAQKEQLALFKFRHTLEVWGRRDVWFQDVASSSYACNCYTDGRADFSGTSNAFMVAPFCLIA